MNPKIFFKYAGIYDTTIYQFVKGEVKLFEDEYFVERKKLSTKIINEIEKWWSQKGEDILTNISKLSGVKWKQTGIKVYLLPDPHRAIRLGGFSDPVTIFFRMIKDNIPKERSLTEVKRIIIHELVHQNVMLPEKYEEYIKETRKKYECNRQCAAHLVVHAILEKVFTKEELEEEMRINHSPDYKLAWEIVKKESADKIINEFVEFE